MAASRYATDVFVNCPFDRDYEPIFAALVFCVFDCGFRPRCALEVEDSAQVRIDKVFQIIAECKYGVHDISRTDLDETTGLPRFNMPLELGIFLAARRYGTGPQKQKVCLILDSDKYRYQKFISDIAGQDIQPHGNDPQQVIKVVRNWLRASSKRKTIPGGTEIYRRYELFQRELPKLCGELRLKEHELTYTDFALVVENWLRENV